MHIVISFGTGESKFNSSHEVKHFCCIVICYIFTQQIVIFVVVSWNSSADWSQGGYKSSQSAKDKESRCSWEDSARNSESQAVPASTHH